MDLTPSPNIYSASNKEHCCSASPTGFYSEQRPSTNRESLDNSTFAQQVVSMLNQKIERRVSWDHQRWLFEAHKQALQQNRPCLAEEPEIENNYAPPHRKDKQLPQIEAHVPDPVNDPISEHSPLQQYFLFTPAPSVQPQQAPKQPADKKGHCNCLKSRCLKMYCECFRMGSQCVDCECRDCSNTAGDTELRLVAIRNIQKKQPLAFSGEFEYKGCRCTRTKCLNGYCDCHANGLMCGKYCKCKQCHNCAKHRVLKRRPCRRGKQKE